MTQSIFELAHMTREDVAEHASQSILLLPTAATEQHGPHLPLGTDSMIGEAIAREAIRDARTASPLVLAPVLAYGSSHHHLIYSALSLSTAAYLAAVGDLLDTAVRSGFRRVFVLNSHGGNIDCVRLATRDTALAKDSVIGSCSYWEVGLSALEQAGYGAKWPVPGHAGQLETSLMLAIRPELVKLDRLQFSDHQGVRDIGMSRLGSNIQAHGHWSRIAGVTDLPDNPSAEFGQQLLTIFGGSVAAVLREFDDLSLSSLPEHPAGRL